VRCGSGRRRERVPDGCIEPPDAGQLILRLARGRRSIAPQVLGYAFVPGVVGTALVDRTREAARRARMPAGVVLGGVVAHEISHLLFGSAHARHGLMQAVWTGRGMRTSAELTP
jgi:hypothetical protein